MWLPSSTHRLKKTLTLIFSKIKRLLFYFQQTWSGHKEQASSWNSIYIRNWTNHWNPLVSHKHSPNERQRDQSVFTLSILITELHPLTGKQIAGCSLWQLNGVCLVSATYWVLVSFPNSQKTSIKAKHNQTRGTKEGQRGGSVASTTFQPLFLSIGIVIRGVMSHQKRS